MPQPQRDFFPRFVGKTLLLAAGAFASGCGGGDTSNGGDPPGAGGASGDAGQGGVGQGGAGQGGAGQGGGAAQGGSAGQAGAPSVPMPSACSKDGWCWENPLPFGGELGGVWGSSAADVWVVGGAMAIHHFDGTNWMKHPPNVPAALLERYSTLVAVWGTGPSDVWASGWQLILHYDGRAWSVSHFEKDMVFDGLWAGREGEAFALRHHGNSSIEGGALLRFDGGGWKVIDSSESTAYSGIWGSAPDNVYVANQSTWLRRWNGEYAESVPFVMPSDADEYDHVDAVWGTGEKNIYAVGSYKFEGTIRHYDGIGAGWYDVTELDNRPLEAIWGSGPNDIWAADSGNDVIHWDGQAWQAMPQGTLPYLPLRPWPVHGWSSGPNDSWLPRIGVAHWDGAQWHKPATTQPVNVIGSAGDKVWLGLAGDLMGQADGAWRLEGLNVPCSPYPQYGECGITGFWALDANRAWAVGTAGEKTPLMLRYDGAAWSRVELPPEVINDTLSHVYAAAEDDLWVAGRFVLAHWDGATWTNVESTMNFWEMWGSSKSDVWAVGLDLEPYGSKVMHYDGVSWAPVAVEPGRIWGTGPDAVWIINEKVVQRWDGKVWASSPMAPNWQSVQDVWGTGPNDIWAVGTGGDLAHYDGTAWTQHDSGTSFDLTGVRGRGAGDVYVVGKGGTILHRKAN